ncbi:MAG: hypothetical protein IKO23_09440 [Bacteroidales bacterium]|nr:hypothetical protein [Bacteroidales bacterium]
MSDTTVRLKIKIEGSDSLKEVEMSADELAKAFVSVKDKVHELNEKLLNINQISQAFEQVGAVVQSLQSVMHDLTDTYAVQAQAEARLEQMMHNTMDATDDEIQSIKDLAAEQQKLGVIGDEVILSGAQELATYMQKKESLEALIPVMDDMIAQQYGYNASAESAVSVAQMMGKVFSGEVGALKRLGYTFDEAQEAILKYGTEEEKVATLTEVVGQIVEGTNAKLAAMPYGPIAKFRNDLGDIKEQLGKMVAPTMNAVDSISKLTIAIAGIGKGVSAIKAVIIAVKAMTTSAKAATAAQKGLNAAMKANVIIAVASAVATLVAIIVTLARKSHDAASSMKELSAANEAYKTAVADAKAEIDTEIAALKNLMDAGKDTSEAVKHLNEAYGEAFGYHQTAADWYDTLTKKSETYCRQLGYEAKAKKLSAEVGELIVQRDELNETIPKGDWQWDEKAGKYRDMSLTFTIRYAEDRDTRIKLSQRASLTKQIEEKTKEMEVAFGRAGDAADQLKSNVDGAAESISWQLMSYEELGKAIKEQTDKLKKYSDGSSAEAKQESATLAAMQQRHHQLGVALGLETENVKKLTNEYKKLAKVELVPALETKKEGPIERAALPTTEAGYDKWIADLQNNLKNATADMRPGIQAEIERAEQLRNAFIGVKEEVGKTSAEIDAMPTMKPFETFTKGWGGIKGIGNSIRDIKSALTETDNAWDALTQTIDGFISLFQSLQSIVEIIKTITAVTQTMQAVNDATTQKQLANAGVQVAANTAVAGSGAASSVASIPYVGPILAIAALASIVAAIATLPKFADGGLVYGPTLGLMGEYGGASSNPEVIAPLSKLRALLGDGGATQPTEVKFRIQGRELVGIVNKQNNIYRRNG